MGFVAVPKRLRDPTRSGGSPVRRRSVGYPLPPAGGSATNMRTTERLEQRQSSTGNLVQPLSAECRTHPRIWIHSVSPRRYRKQSKAASPVPWRIPRSRPEPTPKADSALASVHFDFRWLDHGLSRHSAEDATFAELEIRVGDDIVTGVFERLPSGRNAWPKKHVVVPLLHVAEWLVSNWWHLRCELPAVDDQRPGFESRHVLAHAGEGLVLPKLKIISDAERVHLRWSRWKPKRSAARFVTDGQADVSREALETEFRTLIEAVLERVGSLLGGTEDCESLKADWEAINSLGQAEVELAQAATLLGEDPCDIDDSVASDIVAFWEATPPSIREEALASSSAESLSSLGKWLNDSLARLEESYDGIRWSAVRDATSANRPGPPRTRGHTLADGVRILLEPRGGRFDFDQSGLLGVPVLESMPPCRHIQGLVGPYNPACVAGPCDEASKKYLQARALGDYLERVEPVPGILSSLATDRQAQSRAFADQFLVPVDSIRARLEGRQLNEEAIAELCTEFGVSSDIVRRQIHNHRLSGYRGVAKFVR